LKQNRIIPPLVRIDLECGAESADLLSRKQQGIDSHLIKLVVENKANS